MAIIRKKEVIEPKDGYYKVYKATDLTSPQKPGYGRETEISSAEMEALKTGKEVTVNSTVQYVAQSVFTIDVVKAIGDRDPEFFLESFLEKQRPNKLRRRIKRIFVEIQAQATADIDNTLNISIYDARNGNYTTAKRVITPGMSSITLEMKDGAANMVDDSGKVSFVVYTTRLDIPSGNSKLVYKTPKVTIEYEFDTFEDPIKPRVTLDGVRQPGNVVLHKVNYDIIPSKGVSYTKPRGRDNLFVNGVYSNERYIELEMSVISDSQDDLMKTAKALGTWLHTTDPVELVFMERPEIAYKVLPEGESLIEEQLHVGSFTLRFLCVDIYGSGQPMETNATAFYVGGDVETYPSIDIKVKEPLTNMVIVTSQGQVVLGDTERPAEKEPWNPEKVVLFDQMVEMGPWKPYDLRGVARRGEFETNGYYFSVKGGDYGKHDTMYHGPSAIRALGEEVQDFEAEIWLRYSKSHPNQIGKIGLHLLDKNDVQIAEASFRGADPTQKTGHSGVLVGAGGWIENMSSWYWADFEGKIILSRRGPTFTIRTARFKNNNWRTGKYDDWYWKWAAFDDYTTTLPVAKIGISIAQYQNYDPLALAQIEDIKITRIQTTPPEGPVIPVIAQKDDIISIDCETGKVSRNGVQAMEILNPATDFFKFKPGYNQVSVVPQPKEMNVNFKEKFF